MVAPYAIPAFIGVNQSVNLPSVADIAPYAINDQPRLFFSAVKAYDAAVRRDESQRIPAGERVTASPQTGFKLGGCRYFGKVAVVNRAQRRQLVPARPASVIQRAVITGE